MDVSVLVGIGSFFVSERILRPKATLLVILGCVLAYDLTTKTHDAASLRVYRGPAMIAFTLMCCAYSLRTWRRNGVACDELIFLPGTPHAERHLIRSGSDDDDGAAAAPGGGRSDGGDDDDGGAAVDASAPARHRRASATGGGPKIVDLSRLRDEEESIVAADASEGDAAAGLGGVAGRRRAFTQDDGRRGGDRRLAPPPSRRDRVRSAGNDELGPILSEATAPSWTGNDDEEEGAAAGSREEPPGAPPPDLATPSPLVRPNSFPDARGLDGGSSGRAKSRVTRLTRSPSGSQSSDFDSWEGDRSDDDDEEREEEEAGRRGADEAPSEAFDGGPSGGGTGDGTGDRPRQNLICLAPRRNAANLLGRTFGRASASSSAPTAAASGATSPTRSSAASEHRITRIGSFFFFRSPVDASNAYAPSGPMVLGAAMDLFMPVLINFHLFIEATNQSTATGNNVPAKILPLIFLTILMVRSAFPPGRRKRFWGTVKFTAMAPFVEVNFRDAFVGDVMTSLVRPIQDVLFALFYYGTVVWGTVAGGYGLTEAGAKLERSWLLHTVVIPSFAMLPLWWKFLQTLRQAYDSGRRWPHLGNAFKYLTAALVILYGMAHSESRRSKYWMVCFGLATLYQIWWDAIMDWELFVVGPPRAAESVPRPPNADAPATPPPVVAEVSRTWCVISSVRPSSTTTMKLHRFFVQPAADLCRRLNLEVPSPSRIRLRPKRLHSADAFYWRIFYLNAALRCVWMLSFIPAYHVSPTTGETVETFSYDADNYGGAAIAVAEIARRCLWGLLKVELATIKLTDQGGGGAGDGGRAAGSEDDDDDEEEGEERFQMEGTEEGAGSPTPRDKRKAPSLSQYLPLWQGEGGDDPAPAKAFSSPCGTPSDAFQRRAFVAELVAWACAFVGLGYWSIQAP